MPFGGITAKYRVNLLCWVGAILGIVAIFSTWVKISIFVWGTNLNLIDVMNHASDSILVAGVWLFIVGTLAAFVITEGGVLQIIGVILFLSWFTNEAGEMPSGVGPYLGLSAGVISAASFAVPLGIGYRGTKIRLRDRSLAVGIARQTL